MGIRKSKPKEKRQHDDIVVFNCTFEEVKHDYGARATEISSTMCTGPRVGILGSKSFHSDIGPSLCDALGRAFAQATSPTGFLAGGFGTSIGREPFVLVTGGNLSREAVTIQEQFANAFNEERKRGRAAPRKADDVSVYHLLPAIARKRLVLGLRLRLGSTLGLGLGLG